ncbi:putative bifunctional diguanylate cyclase/phosphodiesterase [Qipengyuania aquimaris]|uniref:putative bifunctional diguanylate cyclase/phosphodiesterase n=1 Tax=Qipengyuania aquimaris TaxID=255984 RepID=UPI001CD70D7E|nr:EAL domain-containing protein [Qipengyuania aquimaris]MCA0904571.1 EAL domain-containing protein [Qipengyuania aquimaris]
MHRAVENKKLASDAAIAGAYLPIVRGYFMVAAAYYAIMTITHFWFVEAPGLYWIASASSIATVGCLIATRTSRRNLPLQQLEFLATIVNLLVVGNVIVAIFVEFSTAKFVYFVMIAMIFAFSSVTMRQAAVSIAIALAGLCLQVLAFDPGNLVIYAFIGFGAAMSAFAIAYFLRRAVSLSVLAGEKAEKEREYAENRLAKAVELSETMRLRSLSDSLTDLPNRRAFYGELEQAKVLAADGGRYWILLLDLDGFKSVNDNYGHIVGDELLKLVARRLKKHCQDVGHVSRIGGDEFSMIFCQTDEMVDEWANSLLASLAQVYQINGRRVQISGSIGYYEIDPGEADQSMLQKADFALLHAKRAGKNRFVAFDASHAEMAETSFRIERALKSADLQHELEIAYQPQCDIESGDVVRVEALARWNSPSIGEVSPDKFIKIAEETGLISNITVTVVRKVFEDMNRVGWNVPVSINLSASDVCSDRTMEEILRVVPLDFSSSGLIEFEVTETATMSDTAKARANLLRLHQAGFPIAIDDFGTGYSNFNYLRTLPIGKLKVDRSFLDDKADPMTERVLTSLVGLARTLEVTCVLEGIECELDLLMARRSGFNLVQGFHHGPPMSIDDLMKSRFWSVEYLDQVQTA